MAKYTFAFADAGAHEDNRPSRGARSANMRRMSVTMNGNPINANIHGDVLKAMHVAARASGLHITSVYTEYANPAETRQPDETMQTFVSVVKAELAPAARAA